MLTPISNYNKHHHQSVKPVPKKWASKINKTFKKIAEHKCSGVDVLFFSAVSFDRVRPENGIKQKNLVYKMTFFGTSFLAGGANESRTVQSLNMTSLPELAAVPLPNTRGSGQTSVGHLVLLRFWLVSPVSQTSHWLCSGLGISVWWVLVLVLVLDSSNWHQTPD